MFDYIYKMQEYVSSKYVTAKGKTPLTLTKHIEAWSLHCISKSNDILAS